MTCIQHEKWHDFCEVYKIFLLASSNESSDHELDDLSSLIDFCSYVSKKKRKKT